MEDRGVLTEEGWFEVVLWVAGLGMLAAAWVGDWWPLVLKLWAHF